MCGASLLQNGSFGESELEESVNNTESLAAILCNLTKSETIVDKTCGLLHGAQFDQPQTFSNKNGLQYTVYPGIVDFQRMLLSESSDQNSTNVVSGEE